MNWLELYAMLKVIGIVTTCLIGLILIIIYYISNK